jgi:hypothetical protein
MSEDDVLFGYRLRVLDHAARTSVSEACRVFGIHRSTYYVWRRRVERHGLEILRPRERRRPRMPQQLSPFVGERIVAFALGHPGYGPRRITIIGIASKAVGGDRRADRPQSRPEATLTSGHAQGSRDGGGDTTLESHTQRSTFGIGSAAADRVSASDRTPPPQRR